MFLDILMTEGGYIKHGGDERLAKLVRSYCKAISHFESLADTPIFPSLSERLLRFPAYCCFVRMTRLTTQLSNKTREEMTSEELLALAMARMRQRRYAEAGILANIVISKEPQGSKNKVTAQSLEEQARDALLEVKVPIKKRVIAFRARSRS